MSGLSASLAFEKKRYSKVPLYRKRGEQLQYLYTLSRFF